MRIAAVDYGLKRIGLAISDEGEKIAFPLKTVHSLQEAIETLRTRMPLKEILVGLPLSLKGEKGDIAIRAETFARKLEEALHVPIRFLDERLSSKQVERELSHLSRKKRASHVDTAAAALLLQTYLDTN